MPAVVSDPLPACADPRSISAPDTRRLATPNKVRPHAASVTIWRDARVPFRSDTAVKRHLCRASQRFRVASPPRRWPISGPSSPASADSTNCYELERPSMAHLATRHEARSRYVLTDFCFPLLRLRAPAPRSLPASLRGLRLALDSRACTRDQETGEPGVSRRPIRFGGPFGLVRGVLLPRTSVGPYL